jgi:hypothetical protein
VYERKFHDFLAWARATVTSENSSNDDNASSPVPEYAVQLVKQVNFGDLESKRYFIPSQILPNVTFTEVSEQWLVEMNFEKLNS